MMRLYFRRVSCIILVSIMLFSITACLKFTDYDGEFIDLYSVAVNNVFGTTGYIDDGEITHDPRIHIIETDDYGRVLYFYNEYDMYAWDPSKIDYGMAFVVMQKSQRGYAYYYPDKCYTMYFDTTDDWETIADNVDTEMLELLKEANDWNQEFNIEKCAKVPISDKKPEGKLQLRDSQFDRILYSYERKNGYTGAAEELYRYSYYCERDSFGRELHYVYGLTKNKYDNDEIDWGGCEYAIIIEANGRCQENGIVKILNVEDTPALINELKQNTKWNLEE